MTHRVMRAAATLTLVFAVATAVAGQDTVVVPPDRLPIAASRLAPFSRSYDVVLQTPDSTVIIGERTVTADRTTLAGAPAWVLVEARTGAVPAVESLYVTPELQPVRWTATQGAARLLLQFARDSIFGGTTSPLGRQNIVMQGSSQLLASSPMVETALPLLPLAVGWTDSAAVLAVGPNAATVSAATLTVLSEDSLLVQSRPARATWVVALATEPRFVLFWVDKETGAIARVQHFLKGGALLEYRLRDAGGTDDSARE